MPEGVNIASSNNKCGLNKQIIDGVPVGGIHRNQYHGTYKHNSHEFHGSPEVIGGDSIKINVEQAKEQTICLDFIHENSTKNGCGDCECNSECSKDHSGDVMNGKEKTGVSNYVNKIKEHINGTGNSVVVDTCGEEHYKGHTWPKVNIFTPSCMKTENSVEVWCLCRLVKPCGCGLREDHADRDATPTPDDDNDVDSGTDDSKSPTPTPDCDGVMGKSSNEGQITDVNHCGPDSLEDKFESSHDSSPRPVPRRSGRRRAELPSQEAAELLDTDSTTAKMDNMSVGSFDHFDFDASFCSLKSTDMTEQGDLADQLSLVQQLVTEMKQGFSTAMDELSKIQYGDQTLQQQLADNKRDCGEQITEIRRAVDDLKTEVQQLSGQMKTVTDVQRSLQDKVDAYHTDKEVLLDELEKNGAITDEVRLRLSSGHIHENNNNNVSPMMHPYLNSLQHHHGEKGPEDVHSDSSLTAALTRSLSLTQALGEKCLHLDLSTTSSDEEETSRHSHASSGPGLGRGHHRPTGHYGDGRLGQGLPPHEQVSAEVHREEAARDMVEAEREYCSHIWSLIENFMTPVQDAEIVSVREFHFLFPAYVPHMYEQHCAILRMLEDRVAKWRFTGVVGDIFAKLTDSQEGDGLGLYKEYIGDFPNIINGMNKWFSQSVQFREVMQSQFLASAPVLPLLLAPLQQVPKYSLLLKNLLKYTPADHPDRYYLESSLNRLKFFLNTMNEDLEHAMQVLNINREPIKRSRDMGSFQRRSSESSGDMNQRPGTRDSGIHSTEEDVAKSPLTPNSTRRFVLQVLREKRDRRNDQMPESSADQPSMTRDRKHQVFGSHPDLSSRLPTASEGRHSPHLASLPQSKMFSSLSKLPLPADRGRRGQPTNTHDMSRPLINRNYLRPLTPQVFPSSTSAHSFQEARRKEEIADRYRPASAIEFTSDRQDFHSSFLNSYRSASPGHSMNSDRSRKDLHLSLQKLLLETGHDVPDESNHDQGQYEDSESSFHKQFITAQKRILRNGSDRDRHQYSEHSKVRNQNRFTEQAYPTHPHNNHSNGPINSPAQEDYGIYGDEDEENYEDEQEEVKPMELLPKSHRPKIMIPRWRKHTSPHPPSYRSNVEGISKPSEFMSQENLASSLAQSLFDGKADNTSPVNDNQKQREHRTENEPNVSKSSSLSRSPRKSDTPKWSDLPRKVDKFEDKPIVSENNKSSSSTIRQHSIESPRRPTNLNLDSSGTATNTPTKIKNKIRKRSFEIKTNSGTKLPPVDMLSDVIHYTADCIDKGDDKARDNGSGSDSDNNPDSHTSRASSGLMLSSSSHTDDSFTHNETSLLNGYLATTTADFTDTITSVNNVQTNCIGTDSVSPTSSYDFSSSSPTITTASPFDTKTNFESASSDLTPGTSVNTDNLVYYFQNRNQQNSVSQHQTGEANSTSETPPTSTITSMSTSSTPSSEQKDIHTMETSTDSSPGHSVKTMGRMVRSDEKNNARNTSPSEEHKTVENQMDQLEKNEKHDKESVMRAVDRLRLSFEKSKQTRQISSQNRISDPRSIQTKLPISANNQPPRPASETAVTRKPHVLTTFSLPQKPIKTDADNHTVDDGKADQNGVDNSIIGVETPDQGHRMYRKAGGSLSPARYSGEPAATARQIQKFERSTSPTTRSGSPVTYSSQERSKSPASLTQASPFPIKAVRIGVSPPRKDVSFIPRRSASPSRSAERPKSATGFTTTSADMMVVSVPTAGTMPLKSSLKETKIPVIKKSPSTGTSHLSKSTEDISKMKKKSAFKDSLKHIFGRKNTKRKHDGVK